MILTLALLAAAGDAVLLDRVVAVADDRPITASQLRRRAAFLLRSYGDAGVPKDFERTTLQELIDQELVAAEAERMRLSVTDAEIDSAISEVAGRAGISAEALAAAVGQVGLTMDEYRDQLRLQLREMKWVFLRYDRDARPEAEAARAQWLTAERERLMAELRARAVVELREDEAFAATGPADAGCPAKLPRVVLPFDGGGFGAKISKLCVLGALEEEREATVRALAPNDGLEAADWLVSGLVFAVMSTGTVHDVRVLAIPAGRGSVTLVYALEPNPPVVAVAVSGNRTRPTAELTGAMPIGARPSLARVRRFARDVQAEYREVGYATAAVDSRLEPADGGVRVLLDVREGERTTLGALRFKGNKVLTATELQAAVHSRVGGPYSQALTERDLEAMTQLFSEHGLLDGRVSPPAVRPIAGKPGAVEVTYALKEGAVFKLRKVGLKGWAHGRDAELLKKLETRRGLPFARSSLRGDLERIAYQAHQHGAEVVVSPIVDFDMKAKAVDVTFDVVTQPKTGTTF